jgi:hypothetical protein
MQMQTLGAKGQPPFTETNEKGISRKSNPAQVAPKQYAQIGFKENKKGKAIKRPTHSKVRNRRVETGTMLH